MLSMREPLLTLGNRTLDPGDLHINHSLLPDLLPSAETYVILKHYVSLPIFATSIICILVTIVVVTRRGIWRPTVTYVVILAIVDLLILVLLSILSLDYFIIPCASEKFRMWFYSSETVLGETVDTLLFISNWLTAMLATERYVAICYPLQSRRIRRKHRRIVVTLVVVVSIIIRIPGFVLLNISNDPVTYPNIAIYHRCYAWLAQVILFLIVPFALLTFVNLRLIQAVRRSSKLLRTTYGTKPTASLRSGAGSQPNSLSDTSNQMSDRRHSSKSTSEHFKFAPTFRSINHAGSIGHSQLEECVTAENLENPKYNMGVRQAGFHNAKLSPNQYAIALTLHGPMGMHVNRGSREERKITVTLVCLVITFFIFQGPSVLISVMIRFTSASKSVIFENLLIPLSLIALAIKSDLYFFLYCWFCERFLNSLCTLFGLRKFRAWVRSVRERCKDRSAVKHYSKPFLYVQKPSVLQEYQLPHHHYGHQGKQPSLYVRGSIAHNRYPYSYKPPPLPFVMTKKRKFPFWSPQVRWNCARQSNKTLEGMKRCKSYFIREQSVYSMQPESKTTFIPPPNSYFSKRRIVVVPESRSRPFSLQRSLAERRHSAFTLPRNSCMFRSNAERERMTRSLFNKPKMFSVGSKQKLDHFKHNDTAKPEASTSTCTDHVIPEEESIKLIASNQEHCASWFPICIVDGGVSRLNTRTPGNTGTVSAPVSTVVDVCVHRTTGFANDLAQSSTDSTLDAEHSSDHVVNPRGQQEAANWSV